MLAVNHPDLPRAAHWRAQAGRRPDALIARNVDAGGVQVERSLFYHFYVLRLASELTEWARRSHVTLPPSFVAQTERMVRYATFVTQPDGTIPLQGSSVEMDVSKLDPEVFAALGERFGQFEYARTGGPRAPGRVSATCASSPRATASCARAGARPRTTSARRT